MWFTGIGKTKLILNANGANDAIGAAKLKNVKWQTVQRGPV
jgi:hypothetical protein